jgi:hypothetical protein
MEKMPGEPIDSIEHRRGGGHQALAMLCDEHSDRFRTVAELRLEDVPATLPGGGEGP